MRRWADALIIAAATAFFVLGTALTVGGPLVPGGAEASSSAPVCFPSGGEQATGCDGELPVTVESATMSVDRGGIPHPLVSLRNSTTEPSTITVEVPAATAGDLHAGQEATLMVERGRPTAVHTSGGASLPTTFDASTARPLQQEGGVSLMGMSALILLVRPRSRTAESPPLGVAGAGIATLAVDRGATAVLRNPHLLTTFAVFTCLQALDGITSVSGGPSGLLEGNPLAGAIAASISPVAGYIAMKLAVVIVMFLAMVRLPRRFALLAGWSGSAMMALVVAHNLVLLSH